MMHKAYDKNCQSGCFRCRSYELVREQFGQLERDAFNELRQQKL